MAEDEAAKADNRRFLRRALLVAAALALVLFITGRLAEGF